MNKLFIFGIILVVIIIFIFYFYVKSNTTTTSTGGDSATPQTNSLKTLTYNKKILYQQVGPIICTSNYANTILYLTPDGLTEYDTITDKTKIINTITNVKGLAYDIQSEKYLVLGKNGRIYNLARDGTLTPYGTTEMLYSELYDTLTGYYLSSTETDILFYSGGYSTKNTGVYGNVVFTLA